MGQNPIVLQVGRLGAGAEADFDAGGAMSDTVVDRIVPAKVDGDQ